MKYLIKQAIMLPLLFFIPLFVSASMVEGYSHISQHGSEITITDFKTAKKIINTGVILVGISCIVLASGIVLNFKKYILTSILIILFGTSMISNGIYPMGTVMHGIYGIGVVLMILPFVACYEFKNDVINKAFFNISLICGIIIFIYLWSIFVKLDSPNYRGLTQRIASIFIFGWIAYFAFELTKIQVDNK